MLGNARAQDLHFQHLTTDDGLSDNTINCVFEDHAGYIWFGTQNGLDRYDGNAVWQVEGSRDNISGIAEDKTGVLWITTKDHGLLRMDPNTRSIDTLRHVEGNARTIASDQLNCVFDLNDTTLLIGSREVSLIFLDKRTLAFSYWTDSLSISPARATAQPSARTGWCHAIIPLDNDRLWIGLLNFQTSLIADRRSGKVEFETMVQRTGSESQSTALLAGTTLYNGGWQNGIDAIDLRERPANNWRWRPAPRVIDTPDEAVALASWTKGRFIAGLRGAGLYLIDTSTGHIEHIKHLRTDPASLASDRIRCLLVDRSGTLWVGTANGLDRHVPSVWSMQVRALYPEEQADQPELTFHRVQGTTDGGVRAFTSEGFFDTDSALHNVSRTDVTRNGMKLQPTVEGKDHDGGSMLGTEYGILRNFGIRGNLEGRFEPTSGGHIYAVGGMYQVRGIWPDSVKGRPVYVVATLGFGMQVIDAASHEVLGMGIPFSASTGKSRFLVNNALRDAKGTYWCGTPNGVFSWHPDMPLFTSIPSRAVDTNDDSTLMAGEDVRELLPRGDTLWGVTRSGSLFSIAQRKVHRYDPESRKSRAMNGLTADRRGALWITTDDGLLRFDPRTRVFIHIPINDGRDFRKLSRAITTLKDGRIVLCADNALIAFDPEAYGSLPELPPAYITSILSAGRSIRMKDGIVQLTYRASVIDIGISALSLRYAQPLVFEYRLDGVESEWRSVSANEAIRYAGVPVGSHPLLVRVRDVFGRVGPEQRLLIIHVAGPIWQRWWFYAIGASIISLGIWLWSRYRLRQALKFQAVRNRIASDLHDEVGSSLSSITIGSQLASQLSGDENEQVKKLMDRIGETSSESLRSMSDIVWAIDPKNDEGDALVKRMRRIAQELLESKGIDVSFSVSGGVEELKLPMNGRKELVLIYKEAVHNASKYSGAELVQVSLHRRNGMLALSVKDDGKGFDLSLHPDGHGLGSMQRRAKALGGELELKSAPGFGTFVSIEVDLTRIRD